MGDSKEFKNGSFVARCLEAIANRDRADRAMSIDWSALPKVPTPLHSDTEAALEVHEAYPMDCAWSDVNFGPLSGFKGIAETVLETHDQSWLFESSNGVATNPRDGSYANFSFKGIAEATQTITPDAGCPVKWWQPLLVKYGTDPYMPNYGMPLTRTVSLTAGVSTASFTAMGPAPEIIKEPPAEIPYSDPPASQIDRLYQDYLKQQIPGPYRSVYACCGPYCPERPPVTKRMKCYTCGELMSEVKNG